MESGYKISVAGLKTKSDHIERFYLIFATELITSINYAKEVFVDIKHRFPEPEFQVSVTHWNCTGTEINWELTEKIS